MTVFVTSDQVRHELGLTAKEEGLRCGFPDLARGGLKLVSTL